MKTHMKNPVIITEEDFNLLKPYITLHNPASKEMSLSAELSRAKIVKNDVLPAFTIRLNSKVLIKDQTTGQAMELTIVLPQYADIKLKRVSILTPIAAALIGFSKGDVVDWQVPAGMKVFKIIEVVAPQ